MRGRWSGGQSVSQSVTVSVTTNDKLATEWTERMSTPSTQTVCPGQLTTYKKAGLTHQLMTGQPTAPSYCDPLSTAFPFIPPQKPQFLCTAMPQHQMTFNVILRPGNPTIIPSALNSSPFSLHRSLSGPSSSFIALFNKNSRRHYSGNWIKLVNGQLILLIFRHFSSLRSA